MKLTQRLLRQLVESVINEAGLDRVRVDQNVGKQAINSGVFDFSLELAGKIINDQSLDLQTICLNHIAKTLSDAGVGGAGVPGLDGNDAYDLLGPEQVDEATRQLESSIADAITSFIDDLSTKLEESMAEHGQEVDGLQ